MKIAVIGTGNVGRALGPAEVVVLALPWIYLANQPNLDRNIAFRLLQR